MHDSLSSKKHATLSLSIYQHVVLLMYQSPSTLDRNYSLITMLGMWLGAVFLLSSALLGNLPMVRSECSAPCVPGSEDIMSPKAHGTSETPVQENLRWGCDRETADRICVRMILFVWRSLLCTIGNTSLHRCGFNPFSRITTDTTRNILATGKKRHS